MSDYPPLGSWVVASDGATTWVGRLLGTDDSSIPFLVERPGAPGEGRVSSHYAVRTWEGWDTPLNCTWSMAVRPATPAELASLELDQESGL